MGFSLVSSIRSALVNESNLFALRGFLRGFRVEDRALASGGTSDGFGSSWIRWRLGRRRRWWHVEKVDTKYQRADIMTKALPKDSFQFLRKTINGW